MQAYQTFMKDSAQLFGAPSPEAHKFAVDIFNFEKRILPGRPHQGQQQHEGIKIMDAHIKKSICTFGRTL